MFQKNSAIEALRWFKGWSYFISSIQVTFMAIEVNLNKIMSDFEDTQQYSSSCQIWKRIKFVRLYWFHLVKPVSSFWSIFFICKSNSLSSHGSNVFLHGVKFYFESAEITVHNARARVLVESTGNLLVFNGLSANCGRDSLSLY